MASNSTSPQNSHDCPNGNGPHVKAFCSNKYTHKQGPNRFFRKHSYPTLQRASTAEMTPSPDVPPRHVTAASSMLRREQKKKKTAHVRNEEQSNASGGKGSCTQFPHPCPSTPTNFKFMSRLWNKTMQKSGHYLRDLEATTPPPPRAAPSGASFSPRKPQTWTLPINSENICPHICAKLLTYSSKGKKEVLITLFSRARPPAGRPAGP